MNHVLGWCLLKSRCPWFSDDFQIIFSLKVLKHHTSPWLLARRTRSALPGPSCRRDRLRPHHVFQLASRSAEVSWCKGTWRRRATNCLSQNWAWNPKKPSDNTHRWHMYIVHVQLHQGMTQSETTRNIMTWCPPNLQPPATHLILLTCDNSVKLHLGCLLWLKLSNGQLHLHGCSWCARALPILDQEASVYTSRSSRKVFSMANLQVGNAYGGQNFRPSGTTHLVLNIWWLGTQFWPIASHLGRESEHPRGWNPAGRPPPGASAGHLDLRCARPRESIADQWSSRPRKLKGPKDVTSYRTGLLPILGEIIPSYWLNNKYPKDKLWKATVGFHQSELQCLVWKELYNVTGEISGITGSRVPWLQASPPQVASWKIMKGQDPIVIPTSCNKHLPQWESGFDSQKYKPPILNNNQ